MKRIFFILCLLGLTMPVSAKDVDYQQVYRDLEVPTLKFVHDMDPGEYYDMQNSARNSTHLFTSDHFYLLSRDYSSI